MRFRIGLLAFVVVVAVGTGYLLGRTSEPGPARTRVSTEHRPSAEPAQPKAAEETPDRHADVKAPPARQDPKVEVAVGPGARTPPAWSPVRPAVPQETTRTPSTPIPPIVPEPKTGTSENPEDKPIPAIHIRKKGPVLNGAKLNPKKPIPAGARIVFPAGQFEWRMAHPPSFGAHPPDVVVVGAGMNATLVRIVDSARHQGMPGWTFMDMTIDADSRAVLFGGKGGVWVVDLNRCRLIGFDHANASRHVGCQVLTARECVFESGYRGNPGSLVLKGRWATLTRFHGCVFRGPFQDIHFHKHRDALHLFRQCRFIEMREGLRPLFENPPRTFLLEDCKVEYADLPKGFLDWSIYRRSVSDINPAWQDPPRR